MRNDKDTLQVLNKISTGIGACILFCMVALGGANMVLRSLGSPVTGTYELMGLGGAMIAALAMGGTQEAKGHIQVTVLDGILPPGLRRSLDTTAHILSTLFFGLLAWRLFELSWALKESGELSETLRLPFYPVVVLVGIGFVSLGLNLIHQTWRLLPIPHENRPK
jgi:TRAP-type C4-dicarboxylate transport system permease small subunit